MIYRNRITVYSNPTQLDKNNKAMLGNYNVFEVEQRIKRLQLSLVLKQVRHGTGISLKRLEAIQSYIRIMFLLLHIEPANS
jgi:hypothetical protein